MQLIFVYNADGGLWNGMNDILHKVFSPSTYPCSLCDLTHGIFSVRKEWADFLKNPPAEFIFLHKDEFIEQYPHLANMPLPCILSKNETTINVFAEKNVIDKLKNISMLKNLVLKKISLYC